MSLEQDRKNDGDIEFAYDEQQLQNLADQMGFTQEARKLSGTRHFLECLSELQQLQHKLIKYSEPGTIDSDLEGRKNMADLMLRATSWMMENGVEGNEDNWDNKSYFIQKIVPVLYAFGYEVVESPKSDLDNPFDEDPPPSGDLPKDIR